MNWSLLMFKVGDKVKVISTDNMYGWTGEIVEIVPGEGLPIGVAFNDAFGWLDEVFGFKGVPFNAAELELIVE